jgi:hypothetical protein
MVSRGMQMTPAGRPFLRPNYILRSSLHKLSPDSHHSGEEKEKKESEKKNFLLAQGKKNSYSKPHFFC